MDLFNKIKETAKKRGLSLQKTSELANLSSNTIYSWKKKSPGENNLKAVADVLGVSTDYLLGNTDEMTPNKKDSNVSTEVDLEKDPVMLSLDGMELTEDYREFIIDQIRSLRKMRGDK